MIHFTPKFKNRVRQALHAGSMSIFVEKDDDGWWLEIPGEEPVSIDGEPSDCLRVVAELADEVGL